MLREQLEIMEIRTCRFIFRDRLSLWESQKMKKRRRVSYEVNFRNSTVVGYRFAEVGRDEAMSLHLINLVDVKYVG